MNRLRHYWKKQSIVSKITFAFSLIMMLIVAINTIGLMQLSYFYNITERNIIRAEQTKSLVLELSVKLERALLMEKDFFLRYSNLGFEVAYQRYIVTAKKTLHDVNATTRKLHENQKEIAIRDDARVSLKLLSLSQQRHDHSIDEAIQLVKELEDPAEGLRTQWNENLNGLYTHIKSVKDTEIQSLYHAIVFNAKQYQVEQKRPDLQRSFNAATKLEKTINASPLISPAEKRRCSRYLTRHFELGEKIADHDILIDQKINELELQTATILNVTTKMLDIADQEIAGSRKDNKSLFRSTVLLICAFVFMLLVAVWIIGKVMGRSVARKIVDLSKVMRAFESGQYSARMQVSSEDEISILAKGFNSMADRLYELINNLEFQVGSRTRALDATNTRLKAEIREHIQSRAELKRQRQLSESIVYNIPILITIYNPQARTLFVNKHFEQTTGWTNEDLKKIDLMSECYPDPHERKEALDYMNRAVNEWKEFQSNTKWGGTLNAIWSNIKLDDDTQIGIGLDVTEQKRREEQIRESLKEKELLLQEIHHRVKNNMQIIASLLRLQLNSGDKKKDADSILRENMGRVYAMAAIHESLYQSDKLSEIDFKVYLHKLTQMLSQTYAADPGKVAFHIDATELKLTIDQANPLGLVLNELVSNSLKYAFPEDGRGTISIQTGILDGNIMAISVADDGIGMPDGFDWRKTGSLGLRMVKDIVEQQLKGSIDLDNTNGSAFSIRIHLE